MIGADINCELYEAVAFKELQPKVSTTMMPLVAAPGIPEFTSLRAMAQRLVNYKAIFANWRVEMVYASEATPMSKLDLVHVLAIQ